MPDDSISEFQAEAFKEGIENGVQGHNLAILRDVVAHLPADATVVAKDAAAQPNHFLLFIQIDL